MQTTLLGLAIALILALLAALVGPHFVNWSDHRAFFEQEASRLVGLDVRVAGPIKVSVLPTPAMTLTDIEIGPAGQSSRLHARSLSIELELGSLMRGEVRAVEARLTGPQFAVGLNSLGRLDWPAMALQTDTVAIERLSIEDARITLFDAASNSRYVLDKLWFRGQVRSLAGPYRGEGAFVSGGEIHGYKIITGRFGDDGTRIKLNVDIAERPLALEIEGQLAGDRNAPRFDGSVALSRPAGSVKASGKATAHEPWRLTGKVKANAQSALLEQIEFQYGPEERAAKLDGAAEVRFGERPRLQGALSARQIDLDRLIATTDTPRRLPVAATQAFAELFRGTMRPVIPVSLTVSIDAVTLGGAVLQGFGADLHADGAAWQIDKLEFRAPGFARASVSGRLEPAARGFGFDGTASVDVGDPRGLLSWLSGQPAATGQMQAKPWQLRGDVTLAADRIGVEQLRAEFDRGTVEGRLAYLWPAGGRAARLDAGLKAAEIDLDALLSFADGAFSGIGIEAPRDIAIAFEAGRARIAGFEARNATARLMLDESGIQIERLSIADFGNASVEASGRIRTSPSPGGSITVALDARELNAVTALTERFAPMLAEPLRLMAGRERSAKLHGTVSLEHAEGGNALGKLSLVGAIGAVTLDMKAESRGKPEHFAVTNLGALSATDARIEGTFGSGDGGRLLAMLGLERFAELDRLASGGGPAWLGVTATGPLNRELRLDGRFVVGAIDLRGEGRLRLPSDLPALVALEQVSGTIAGSKVQGRLALRFGEEPRVDVVLDTDTLNVAAVASAAIGMRPKAAGAGWPTDPFVAAASPLIGRVEFKAARAALSPSMQMKQLRGVARFGASEVVFDELEGELAQGRASARAAFVTAADGVSMRARVSLNGADAALLIAPGAGKRPVAGRLTLSAELEASGRSPAAFIGSLAGNGQIAIEDAQLAGLNPRVFDAAIRAADLGIPTDAGRIRDFAATALDTGTLQAVRAESEIVIAAGQARFNKVVTRATGADLAASANLDLSDGGLDAVLTMTGTAALGGGLRPTLTVGLRGPLASPVRSVDANALASWLQLRSLEQQAQQVDAMERMRREKEAQEVSPGSAVPSALPESGIVTPMRDSETDNGSAGAAAVPPLPPAINVAPAPKPRAVPRVENPAASPPRAAAPKPPVNPPLDLLGAQR